MAGAGGEPSGGGGPLPPELVFKLESDTKSAPIQSVWGSGPDDIYAVGSLGTLAHYTGGKWRGEDAGTSATLTAVWGSGAGDVYVSVNANVILHSTGNGTWTRVPFDSGYTFATVWGTGKDDVYASASILFHNDGSGDWAKEDDLGNVNSIWGSSATDLYAVGNYGAGPTVFHSAGDGHWQPQSNSPKASLASVSGSGPTRLFAAGSHFVFSSKGDGDWTQELSNDADSLKAVWAPTADAVFACGQLGSFYRSNGSGDWSEAEAIDPVGLGSTATCLSIWGTGPDDIYLGTLNGVYRGVPAR